jgi:signal transduction histidine kinase
VSRSRLLLSHPEEFVVLAGALVLVGWALDLQVLKSLSSTWSSMKANEALSFVLAGVALALLRAPAGGRAQYAGRILAGIVALVGLLTIAEYAFGWDLRIDELLFHEARSAPGAGDPGRMSVDSAFGFVLAGVSLVLLNARRPRRLRPAQMGAIGMSVLATVSIAGYLFSAPAAASGFSGQVMRVGLHTAFAFIVLGAAILVARPGVGVIELITSPHAGGTLLRRLLPAAAAILLTVGWARLKGEEAGLYNFRVGLALMVTAAISALALAVVVTGRSLERTDVERRRMLDEIRARTAELEVANKELEAFSYSVSHDLRAPLRAIDGFTRILGEEFSSTIDPNGRRYLDLVGDNARRMGALIDGLLAFSKLGQQSLTKRRVGVERLVKEAIADVEPQLGGRNVDISLTDLERTVEADPTLLKQVFVNLLSNAIKYTQAREAPQVEVGSYGADGEIVFFVRDNGCGFDMRYADKLFQVFQRLHRAEDYEGAGIGLALVARIVKRHGGGVWASAQLDQGATFYFTLDEGAKR